MKPSEGEVNLIDQEYNNIEANQVMSYLAQEPIVIQGSILENIRLSENDAQINQSKILQAIKFAVTKSCTFHKFTNRLFTQFVLSK